MSKAATSASDLPGRLAGAACDQDETVLSVLEGQTSLTPEQVHQVRVAVKRLRAIWRVMPVWSTRRPRVGRTKPCAWRHGPWPAPAIRR